MRLLSVNIARPKIIGTFNGEPVLSAIGKKPVSGKLFVGALGIAGDQVGDPSVHGGLDKAVYAYPADNWGWWEREHSLPCAPATFGENLTLEGADETQIAIGDRFQWGDAVLEVAQPRGPCFKLGIHTGRPETPQQMTLSGRVGWYLRVLTEGEASADAGFARISASGGPNVRDAFFARHDPRTPKDVVRRVHDAPALAENWREGLARRLG